MSITDEASSLRKTTELQVHGVGFTEKEANDSRLFAFVYLICSRQGITV
jgi:hypothetical protein